MARKTIRVAGKSMSADEFAQTHNLTVSGDLYLRGTGITALPDGLTVGGWLELDPYSVTFPAPGRMKIGCEDHAIEEWAGFDNTRITMMEREKARRFWKVWREPLLAYARARMARQQDKAA